ncbi:MAG: asparagine synthase-related protein [Calditrichaceae bacterium]
MAGLFGYQIYGNEYNSSFAAEILLKKAKQNFNHPSKMITFNKPFAGIGFAMPYLDSAWPVKSEDGRYYCQIFGEIILPQGYKLNTKNFGDDFLKPYLKSGHEFLIRLKGAFAFLIYDKFSRSFILVNDPFGNFAIYYYSDDKISLISSQQHAITKIIGSKQFDEEGFGQFLGLGCSLNGNTMYRNIRRLQAAEIVFISPEGLNTRRYYTPLYTGAGNVKNEINNIKNAIVSSIKLQLSNYDSIGAALTGGFDSRVTWAVINKLKGTDKVTAFTHGMENSRDIRIAKRIAASLELNHKFKIFDKPFIKSLPDVWSPFVSMTEGLVPITAAHAVDSWKYGQNFYQLLLDSHGGALYRRQFMKVAGRKISNSLSFSEQFFKFTKSALLNLYVLKKDIQINAVRQSIKGLEDYFGSIRNNKAPGDKIDLFYIHQISANKYSSAGNVQMNWLRLSHPFLDLDAFNAIQKIPVRYRQNQSIYKYIIDQSDRRMKKFSMENMGMPAPYHGFTFFRYVPMIYELLLQKFLAKKSSQIYRLMTLKQFTTDYDFYFRINFTGIKDILLEHDSSFFELVDKKKMEELLRRAERHDEYRLSSLSPLITLKLLYSILRG